MKLNKFKMPKDAIWLVPGLQVKRWFALIIIGAVLAALGLMFVFRLEPLYFLVSSTKEFIRIIPPEIVGVILIAVGAVIFLKAWQQTNFSLMGLIEKRGQRSMGEEVYRRMKLNHGPKIVAIGGGTGLSTLLRGIKKMTNNITAIVTVGDDGGSSGRLREEMGILPPGDIRNCVAALADDDDIVTKLFQYRFKTGEGLEGHSFGNLFITAMSAICGDIVTAIKNSSDVLLIRGRVLPSTTDDMRLIAIMEDGSIVKGESQIPEAGKRIIQLKCSPECCKPTEDVIDAINDADLIILGPGSLYTSIIPNLLVEGVAHAVESSKAKKVYICNIMTQPGETDNYSVSDHVKAIFSHAKEHGAKGNLFDTVIVNDILPHNLAQKYEEANSHLVRLDTGDLKRMDVKVVRSKLIEDNKEGLVRHSPNRLARSIFHWYKQSFKKASKEQSNDDLVIENEDKKDSQKNSSI